MKKKLGFYALIVSAVLLIAALATYGGSYVVVKSVYTWLAVALVIEAVGLVLTFMNKKAEWINWIPGVGAVVAMWGLMQGVNSMLDACGYVVAGLYLFSDIQGWVVFMVIAVLAVIAGVVAGFSKLAE